MSSQFPPTVQALCSNFGAWIVGSAALEDSTDPRDYDVQVPFSEWGKACHLIPKDAQVNSMGGWKFKERFRDKEVEIDVWPGELGFVFQQGLTVAALQPMYGVRLIPTRAGKIDTNNADFSARKYLQPDEHNPDNDIMRKVTGYDGGPNSLGAVSFEGYCYVDCESDSQFDIVRIPKEAKAAGTAALVLAPAVTNEEKAKSHLDRNCEGRDDPYCLVLTRKDPHTSVLLATYDMAELAETTKASLGIVMGWQLMLMRQSHVSPSKEIHPERWPEISGWEVREWATGNRIGPERELELSEAMSLTTGMPAGIYRIYPVLKDREEKVDSASEEPRFFNLILTKQTVANKEIHYLVQANMTDKEAWDFYKEQRDYPEFLGTYRLSPLMTDQCHGMEIITQEQCQIYISYSGENKDLEAKQVLDIKTAFDIFKKEKMKHGETLFWEISI